jgi:nicotinate-nucleotide adenylyltransferase
MSIAVLGGTFDPIHLGHLGVARAALDHLAASVCILVVGDAHCHRPSPVLTRTERIELVCAAVATEPRVEEATALGVAGSSVLDVARALADVDGDLHFCFGADSAHRLVTWGGDRPLRSFGRIWAVDRLQRCGPGDVERLRVDVPHVSSTEVRERLARGMPIDHLVPSTVHDAVQAAYRHLNAAALHA